MKLFFFTSLIKIKKVSYKELLSQFRVEKTWNDSTANHQALKVTEKQLFFFVALLRKEKTAFQRENTRHHTIISIGDVTYKCIYNAFGSNNIFVSELRSNPVKVKAEYETGIYYIYTCSLKRHLESEGFEVVPFWIFDENFDINGKMTRAYDINLTKNLHQRGADMFKNGDGDIVWLSDKIDVLETNIAHFIADNPAFAPDFLLKHFNLIV